MDQLRFESLLGEFTHRKPFVPFVIELNDGRSYRLDAPEVAFHEDGCGFISEQDGLVILERQEVRDIRAVEREMAS